ncbi:hypothetical protein E3P99_01207 [Wallemia hederae]|uniref:SPX domain-containing protein n=1 Tax=Wallemia hederae TaxID=1540922 RepID=A0A4T0FRI9_9BASI|nr:hypothetical protein E3P99_01207 [Wallemia hederae]
MKFGKEIQSNQIPGWSHQYLDYKALKKVRGDRAPKDAGSLSIGIRPSLPSRDTAGENKSNVSIEEYRSAFFFKLERELEKINAFYLAKESELKIRIQILIDKKRFIAATNNKQSNEIALDEGFQYLERQLVALQEYVDINATGFRKILKKWDKRSKSNTKELYLARQVEVQPVFNREVLAELSNVVATNLIDLENLRKQSHQDHQDQHADPMSIESIETNSDIENIIIKLLKKGNTQGLLSLLENHKGLRLTWESLAYASTEQIEALTRLATIEWSYVDDINNRTCLHKAAIVGNLSLVLLALNHGVNSSRTDIFGRNSIHYAALNGHNHILDHLLKLKVVDPSLADYDGYTPSLYTIVNGHDECLKLLVTQLSSPTSSNLHPLCLAAQYGHESIVKTLLGLSSDDIGPNAEGLYAQHLAARGGHANICKLLATQGGQKQGGLHIKDKYSAWTPLMHAADGGHLECVQVLLSFGCDSAALDENDNTAVFYAAWNGHMECVDALMKVQKAVEAPADPDIKTPTSEKQGGDLDEIPTLALPPPMMPLRIYGHNYLLKRSLLKVVLQPSPIKLSENGDEFRWSSLKLIVMQKPDMLNAPHHLIIPSQKQDVERTPSEFAFQIEDEKKLSLDFAIYPGFGSVVMGKAVALPQVLMRSKDNKHTLPIIDNRLNTIGRITFDTFLIKPYAGLEEQSANVNAYWKSTTNVSTGSSGKETKGKRDSPTLTPNDGQGDAGSATVITSSSLPSDFVRVAVQSSKDGRAVVRRGDGLPFSGLQKVKGVSVGDFNFEDLCCLARENGVDAEALGGEAKLTSLESLLDVRGVSTFMTSLTHLKQTIAKDTHILLDVSRGTASNANINAYIDDILNISYATASSTTRNIAFVTPDTDIAVCLQWKQPHFPVFLSLTSEGSVKEAVKFIKSNNLLGLFVNAQLVQRVPKLVDAVKESGSMVVADVGQGVRVSIDGVDGVASTSDFNCLTTFTAPTPIMVNIDQLISQYKPSPEHLEEVSAGAFIYAILSDHRLSVQLPFQNHIDLHSFSKAVEQEQVPKSVRDVVLAYAIPSVRAGVANGVKRTAEALLALDSGEYNVGGLLNSPEYLHTQCSLKRHYRALLSTLHSQPESDTQVQRSSRVIALVRTSRDKENILGDAECEKLYISALASKSVASALRYLNELDLEQDSYYHKRRVLLEEILTVALLPHPSSTLLQELSKLSLEDDDVDAIRQFATGTSRLTSPSVAPVSIAAAHDLLLVRYIQKGQIPDAIKLNKGALSVVLSHGIGSVKRSQLIAEAWSVLPRVQKDMIERETGKLVDEHEHEHELGEGDDGDESMDVAQDTTNTAPTTKPIGSWIDVRLEQERKAPGTPFAPLPSQRKVGTGTGTPAASHLQAPSSPAQSPLSGPPRFSTPTAPASTPLRNTQTKHKVAESPFAQLLGKSIAREKERKEREREHEHEQEQGDLGRSQSKTKSAFGLPSVTEIASRSLNTPVKHSQTPKTHTRTPEVGNESKDKITDLPDTTALYSVRKTRNVMPTPVKVVKKDDDDDDVDVPGSYPYTPQPPKQQPRRNLRSTTLRSSARRTSIKRNSDDVHMDDSDDDDDEEEEVQLPGSYIPTPQQGSRAKKVAGGAAAATSAPKSTAKRSTRRTSGAPETSAPPKRQTRSSSRLNG